MSTDNQAAHKTHSRKPIEGATPSRRKRPQLKFIEGEIARIELKAGDRLVVVCKEPLSMAQRCSICDALEERFPGVPCLVLDGGLRLAVLSADASDVTVIMPEPTEIEGQ